MGGGIQIIMEKVGCIIKLEVQIKGLMLEIFKKKRKNAFTLAEVLITIGIIGVVAAITIPTLVKNVQDYQYKVAYKKAYSEAQQALLNANGQDSMNETPYAQDNQVFYKNFQAFMDQFKITKKCINNDNEECWDSGGEKYQIAWPQAAQYSFIDSSGVSWSMISPTINCVLIDTNGLKNPNQYGKDRFAFYMFDKLNSYNSGLPIKIAPYPDNFAGPCTAPNKCAIENNYYGTSWLYN